MKNKKRLLMAITVILCLLVFLTACGSGADSKKDENSQGQETSQGLDASNDSDTSRKIVYTERAQIETKEYRKSMNAIYAALQEDDYVESSEEHLVSDKWNATVVLRIKTERLAAFKAKYSEWGTIISASSNSEDVTLKYSNFEATKEAYQKQLKIYQDLLKQEMEKNNPSITNVEQYSIKITELERKINESQTNLNILIAQIEFSTVTLMIYEKGSKIEVEKNYSTKLGEMFANSWKALGVFFQYLFLGIIAVLPFAIFGAVVFVGVFFLIKYIKKRKNKIKGNNKIESNEKLLDNNKKPPSA